MTHPSDKPKLISRKEALARGRWRDVFPIHPAAELFPLMSESELHELSKNIKKNGLQNFITLCNYKNKLCVLDGRNRLDAMELAGMKTVGDDVDIFRACKTDPYEYVLSANIHRRHLTSEQKRELIAKVLKAKPKASNRQIAKQTKADDKTVAKVRREMEGRSEIPHVETRTDTKGRDQPAQRPQTAPATLSAEISEEQRRAENAHLDDHVEADTKLTVHDIGFLNATEFEIARKIVMVIGRQRAALLAVELKKLLSGASEAA